MPKYACAICGQQRDQGIWWLAIHTGAALTIRIWNDNLARYEYMKHLCGDEHRDQYVQKWANERKLAAERQMGEVSL